MGIVNWGTAFAYWNSLQTDMQKHNLISEKSTEDLVLWELDIGNCKLGMGIWDLELDINFGIWIFNFGI